MIDLAGDCLCQLGSITPGCRFLDRKSTRLNSSHQIISYAVFCLKKKKVNLPYSRKFISPLHNASLQKSRILFSGELPETTAVSRCEQHVIHRCVVGSSA